MAGSDFETIFGGLADALRDRDPDRIGALLAPDVVWEGLQPDLRCNGWDEAMGVIRHRFAAGPLAVEALEVIAGVNGVVVGMRGPGFNGIPGDVETVGQMYNVFTLADGKVVRWRDFLGRQEALAAASVGGHDWR
ncbi:MAG: nuclear transport factor 2 family protein [Acidimicrobiales bacterium]